MFLNEYTSYNLKEVHMVYSLSKMILWPFLRQFIVRIDGLDSLPRAPYILAANHSSYIDGVLLIFLIAWYRDEKLHVFATNEKFTGPFWDILFQHFGAIRINGSLAKGIDVLKKGHPLLIFPEGARTETGKLRHTNHTGLGVLALKSRAPIVPVHLNTFWWWNMHRRLPTFAKTITIAIGKPKTYKGSVTTKRARNIVHTTLNEVKRLA